MVSQHDSITYGRSGEMVPTLWGCAGGQLEFISMRMEQRQDQITKRWYPVVIMRFTDHDVQATHDIPRTDLVDNQFYELEFTIHS